MHTRTRLPLVSIVLALSLTSCGTGTDSEAITPSESERSTGQSKPYVLPDGITPSLADAARITNGLVSSLQENRRDITKDNLLPSVNNALTRLQMVENPLAGAIASAPTAKIKNELSEASSHQQEGSKQLTLAKQTLEIKTKQELSNDERQRLTAYSTAAQKAISNSQNNIARVAKEDVPPPYDAPSSTGSGLSEWLPLGAMVLAGTALIFAVVFGIRMLRKRYWEKLDYQLTKVTNSTVDGIRRQQGELLAKLENLDSTTTAIKAGQNENQFELKSLARMVRDLTPDRFRDSSLGIQRPAVQSREEPAFPVSVDDFIEKTRKTATVIRPDFQKGILVVDPISEGQLMLDGSANGDGWLLMVPRVAQFLTRQDFHTYFGKYYECQNPTAGEVWIVTPAFVSTVPGGWELREKGVLEVR